MANCLASGPRQEHAVIKGLEEPGVGNPSPFFHQFLVHDGNLTGRPAETDEAQLEPEFEGFPKEGWGVGSITLFPNNFQIIKVTSGIGLGPEPYFAGPRKSRVLQLQVLPARRKSTGFEISYHPLFLLRI